MFLFNNHKGNNICNEAIHIVVEFKDYLSKELYLINTNKTKPNRIIHFLICLYELYLFNSKHNRRTQYHIILITVYSKQL